EQDRLRLAGTDHHLVRRELSRGVVARAAYEIVLELDTETFAFRDRVQDRLGRRRHLRTDPVAPEYQNFHPHPPVVTARYGRMIRLSQGKRQNAPQARLARIRSAYGWLEMPGRRPAIRAEAR